MVDSGHAATTRVARNGTCHRFFSPVRFDEREVETGHGMRLLRHSRGTPETDYVEAYPTAPPLDSTPFPFPLRGGLGARG